MRSFFAVILACILAAGCGKGNFSKQASAGKENVLRYPIPTNPTSLDPAIVRDGDTIDALQQVYEGLVAWDINSKVVPNLADHWVVSPDGRTYTFTLKKGVKFFNGREVTAEDVKFSIERACDPDFTKGMAINYLDDIVGVKERVARKAPGVNGVKVSGPYEVQITIEKPRNYFLQKLTYPVGFVVAKEAMPTADGHAAEITKIDQMVGTGPFKPESYEENQLLVLSANTSYHGGAPKIASIERPVIKDAQTRLSKFRSGELDIVSLQRQDVEALKNDAAFKDQLHYYPRPAIWYVGFNLKIYPQFANLKVRQAFAMSINREHIVKDILGGLNDLADTILPPVVPGHRDKGALPAFDPQGAKKMLAEAGFPGGKGFPDLEIDYREGYPDIRIVAEAVQNDLKTNLGINCVPRAWEWKAYLAKENANQIGFLHMRWAADYLDPQNFLSMLLTTNGPENHTYYSNPQVDDLCNRADALPEDAERMKLYAQAEDLILKDCAWIPIYFQKDVELINPRVQGMRESAFGHLPHTTTSLMPQP